MRKENKKKKKKKLSAILALLMVIVLVVNIGLPVSAGEMSSSGSPTYGVNATESELHAAPYTVSLCVNHSWGVWSDAKDGTHSHTCEYCDETESEDHTCENGFCGVCGGYEPAVWNEADGRYEISNGGQLFWFAELVNGKSDGENSEENSSEKNPAASGVLTADINLENCPWTAIGGDKNAYTGTFDGGGHAINGLSITAASSYQGLFGYCGATVYRCETCGGEEGFTNDHSQAGKQAHQVGENYHCIVCGAQMVASVTTGEETAYYDDIAEAFKAAGAAGNAVVVTLLEDAQVSKTLTVPEGSNITLKGTDSAGNTYTLSGDVNAANSGLIDVRGGSFTLESGTVRNGENGTNAIAVNGGSFSLEGGTVIADASGNSGVCVYSGTAEFWSGSASGYNGVANVDAESFLISGGTFTGTSAAVYMRNAVEGTVKSLLDDRKAYYKDTIDAENLITDLSGKTLPAGTVTVGDCTHSCDTWTEENDGEHHGRTCVVCEYHETEEHHFTWMDNGDGKHAGVCDDCGAKLENESHSYGSWIDDRNKRTHSSTCTVCGHKDTANHTWDESGNCTVCGAEGGSAASVTSDGSTEYFLDIQEAWAAAKEKSGATVTLLRDVTATEPLKVEDGDEIILESKTSAGDWYSISGAFDWCGIIQVSGGSFTMNGGRLSNKSKSGGFAKAYDLEVSGGTAVVNNGEFVDGGHGYTYGMYITGGVLEVYDCTITVKYNAISAIGGGDVRINGGTITGANCGINVSQMGSNGKLWITGGKISSSGSGVGITNSAVEITGGEITGSQGVEALSSAMLTVSGGKISGNGYGLYAQKISTDSRITGGIFTGGTASMYVRPQVLGATFYSLVRDYYCYAVDENGNETQIPENMLWLLDDIHFDGGLQASDGYGTVTVRDPGAEEVVSVEVSWGALDYTYTGGAWNLDTHTYEEGQWTANRGGDCITVRNRGNVDVTVFYQYIQSKTEVFGNFADENGKLIDSPVALYEWEEKKAYLMLTGKPQMNFSNELIGTVTVTIGGE